LPSRLWYVRPHTPTRRFRIHETKLRAAGREIGQEADIVAATQGTSDVRLDPQLNKKVWEQGVKGVPYRLRIRISRRRNDEEGAKEKLYSYVQAVNVKNPKGLHTVVVEE
jgi:large subunit ribosomal protein L31e